MKVLPKIIQVLELFAHGEVLTFAEVAERSGLTRSNTAHILSALCESNLLAKPRFGVYCMGEKIFALAGGECHQNILNMLAWGSADRIASELGELGVVVGFWKQHRVTLAKVQPESMVQLSIADRWFEKSGWYRLSAGRLLLALQSDEVIESIVQKIGLPSASEWLEAITPEKFAAQVQHIRQTRQAVVMRENGRLTSLAVPVKDASGADTLCVSTVYITGSHQEERIELIGKLRKIAGDLHDQVVFHHISMQDMNQIPSRQEVLL